MLRKSVLGFILVAAISGCGESGQAPETGAAPAGETAAPPPPVPAALSRADAIAALTAGKTVKVVFDTCPMSDEGWTGDTDPYGTIKCGETYTITYSVATSQYTATGLNEGSGSEATSAAGGTTPADGGISIWGATFILGDDGIVSTSDGTHVGHIKIG
ncbi:MAG TPA: hypothetical protein VGO52_01005 [Hyphomonadaceae bacterium]|jgi:hypothetical protein|nr:hypothetical protein [Hyphomonadaceae bacterium]